LLELHVTTRFVSTLPFASFAVAVNASVTFTASVAEGGDTTTLLTGTSDTVTVAVPLCPLLVAVIFAVPVPTAVTTPLDEMLAMPVFELDHTTGVPVTTAPVASRVVAASCVVCATNIDTESGVTTTAATGP
jgi:hypothetical protein